MSLLTHLKCGYITIIQITMILGEKALVLCFQSLNNHKHHLLENIDSSLKLDRFGLDSPKGRGPGICNFDSKRLLLLSETCGKHLSVPMTY